MSLKSHIPPIPETGARRRGIRWAGLPCSHGAKREAPWKVKTSVSVALCSTCQSTPGTSALLVFAHTRNESLINTPVIRRRAKTVPSTLERWAPVKYCHSGCSPSIVGGPVPFLCTEVPRILLRICATHGSRPSAVFKRDALFTFTHLQSAPRTPR